MKTTLSLLILFCALTVKAQNPSLNPQVVSTAGGFFENGNLSLSYTIGELAVRTLTAGNLVLTQGFQQPFGLGVYNREISYLDWQVKTWPNPVASELFMQVTSDIRKDLFLEAYSLTGKLLFASKLESPLSPDPYNIDMSKLARGIYILKIRTADYSLQRIVKIQKQ